jgi:hypothetical protein
LELNSWGKIQNHSYEDEKERIRNILTLISLHEYNDFLVLLHEALQSDNVEVLIQLIDRLLAFEWPHKSFEEVICTIYLIRKISELHQRGFDIDAKTILSKLYDFAMKQGVFSEHSKLSHITFSNIVSYHCTFQSYDFTHSFIHKWYKDVATSYPTTTRDISLALVSFKFGEYKELIELTRMKNFADHQEKALALLLHLIGTFMNRNHDYEMFENDVRNFSSYMTRNKKEFSTKIFKGKMNLVDVLKRVDKKSKNIDLKSYDYLFFRDWCVKVVKDK